MKILFILCPLFALLAGLAFLTFSLCKTPSPPLTDLANISGGTYESGVLTRRAEEAFGLRYLLGTPGTNDGEVAICAADEEPLYIVEDEPSADDPVACAVLGNASGLRTVIGSGVIEEGENIITDAGGKVQSEANADAGSYYRVGKAMSAAGADGDEVTIAHQPAVAVTIS